jgi:hypothetical protein
MSMDIKIVVIVNNSNADLHDLLTSVRSHFQNKIVSFFRQAI